MTGSSAIRGLSYSDDVRLLRDIYQELHVEERIHDGNLTVDELVWTTMILLSEGALTRSEIRKGLSQFLAGRSH